MSPRFGITERNALAPDASLPQTEAVVRLVASYTGKVVSASRLAPCTLATRTSTQVQRVGSRKCQIRVANLARSSGMRCQRPSPLPPSVRSAGGGSLQSRRTQVKLTRNRRSVWPNRSLNPRRATAGVVSLVRASRTIVAYQAYAARLRARG